MTESKAKNLDKSLARLVAVQILFEAEATRARIDDILAASFARPIEKILDNDDHTSEKFDKKMTQTIVEFASKNQTKIDQTTNDILAEGWKLAKIDPTLRAIFRAAGAEFLIGKAPLKVIINEYLGVTRAFQDEREPMAFANAVLDRIGKSLSEPT